MDSRKACLNHLRRIAKKLRGKGDKVDDENEDKSMKGDDSQ